MLNKRTLDINVRYIKVYSELLVQPGSANTDIADAGEEE